MFYSRCSFDGSLSDINNLFNFLNNLHPSISFTMGTESNQKLPYLDILLHRKPDHIEFSIFHKPTSTDFLIPYSSNHPLSQKLASVNCFFHRLFHIPMSEENFNIELSCIATVASRNNFLPLLVHRIHYNDFTKFIKRNLIINESKENKKYFT